MPLFEFECEQCGETFEELVRSSVAITDVLCPTCQSSQIHKKMSTFASHLAGGSSASSGRSASAASCAPGGI
jgi:putative FmdB family regulatory protein